MNDEDYITDKDNWLLTDSGDEEDIYKYPYTNQSLKLYKEKEPKIAYTTAFSINAVEKKRKELGISVHDIISITKDPHRKKLVIFYKSYN